MPDDNEPSRLPAALDAPLARLVGRRDAIAKDWLLRVVRRTPLDEIERMPTDRLARELPDVIDAVLRALEADVAGEGPSERDLQAIARLVELRAEEGAPPAALAHDVSDLQAVTIAALRNETADTAPHAFVDAVERLASVFGAVQATAIDVLLGARTRELEKLANTDPLTGLYNVRWLRHELGRLVDVQHRYGHPFALLLLDIDGLKRVNDSLGHAAGDRVLLGVAAAILGSTRSVDTPTRIGGDEFCVLAPLQTAPAAAIIGERIADAVEHDAPEEMPQVGISIGIVSCPEHGEDPDRLLELGDEAMYRAKSAGQRVALADAG